MNNSRYNNKIVVITGATSGIGEAIARSYCEEGAKVVLIGRNADVGMNLQNEMVNSIFCKCDVAIMDEVQSVHDKIISKYGRIDIIINNAGIMLNSNRIVETSINEWEKTFDINVNGVFNITKVFINDLIDSKGSIINVASVAGMHSYVVGQSYAYSASKSAVIQFTRQIALNYASKGVRVNCICPGIVDTPIISSRNKDEYVRRIPIGYIAEPKDVANVVLFLTSHEARYLTGIILPIDGGLSL